ncbi:MAG: sigma 54-interacting transcriptional regulator [Clostridiales Family XIII bacterium]|jgi:transcriptional regulator with PAS, ATPase and Fis domain|nr:sigma 54-interacting transcriptional regulator [Clostridiales Family XIII bacterium]
MLKHAPDIETLKLILDHVLGLMVIDVDGKVTYMNRQCADYIHVDLETSIGKPIEVVFPPTTMRDMLSRDEDMDSDFYFAEGRVSFSTRQKLRGRDGAVLGVIEYDLLQELDSLQNFVKKYTHILTDELAAHGESLKKLQRTRYSINNIIGSSSIMRELKQNIMRAATTNSTVLITGETGTGKELVAHSVHNLSNRTFGSFIKINAAALPTGLEESEFFGDEEGAFTGAAKQGKKGKFELADKGTLFIDEINQMPQGLQSKILRAIQEREVDRIGSKEPIPVDVRIIAATNEDISELITRGRFRDDLYYRLNVFPIDVPPLRAHKEDIPELVMNKIVQLNLEFQKTIMAVDDKVFAWMEKYDWPGNVRELYNLVENAMHYADGDTLRYENFDMRTTAKIPADLSALKGDDNPIETVKRDAERRFITEALALHGGSKTRTAKYLNIARPLLYQKMKRLNIT